MKILFLTYFYYDIHIPILQEMKKQGHIVTIMEDKEIPFDYHRMRQSKFKRAYKWIMRHLLCVEKRYWIKLFKERPDLDSKYDVIVCQPGYSFCSYLLKRLKEKNSKILSCVMIHDSSNYYDYYYNRSLYDRVYTYDYEDAREYPGVSVLGAYWVPTESSDRKYQIVLIGSDHDDRVEFVRKIYPQLLKNNIDFYIKVVSIRPSTPQTLQKRVIYILKMLINRIKRQDDALDLWNKKMSLPFVTDKPISIEKVQKIINSSNCVLEIDREGQSGATLRDMWALANGKKIVTTNSYLTKLPFFNPDQIMIIDRHNPIIDINFIKTYQDFPINDILMNQRIDKWVMRLLNFS